jgi:hypothetical protein
MARSRSSGGRRRGPLARLGGAGRATWRFLADPVRDNIAQIGSSIRDERELRPSPIGLPTGQLGRVYSYALYGVAILTVLAFVNNRTHFAGAFLLALALAAMFVVWSAHRSIFLTSAVVLWWAATAPFVALLTTEELSYQLLSVRMASSTPLFWATGAAVWLAALLMRARRPWLALLMGWIVAFIPIAAVSRFWRGDYSYYVAWGVLALYLAWRSGALRSLTDVLKGRAGLGRDYTEATEAQYQAYKQLNALPRGYRVHRQLQRPGGGGGARGVVDALVVGPTGVFFVAALEVAGEITVAAGRPRRILAAGKPLDRALIEIATTARALRQELNLELTTLVSVYGGEFPNRGLLAARARLPKGDGDEGEVGQGPEELTLIDCELLADRVRFGAPVYTAGQVARATSRVRRRLEETPRTNGSESTPQADETDTPGVKTPALALP